MLFSPDGGQATAHSGTVASANAHLGRAVSGPAAIRVRIAKDGAVPLEQAANSLSPAGDVVSFSYTRGNAGTSSFAVVPTDGSALATGTLSVR